MANFYLINGYWKDNKETFENYLVTDTDEVLENDEDVFYYGLSENEIVDAIKKGEDTVYDFVITSYENC